MWAAISTDNPRKEGRTLIARSARRKGCVRKHAAKVANGSNRGMVRQRVFVPAGAG